MELSKRLNFIINNIDNTTVLADIGTDHGYIPLYATQNGLCSKAIAIDINKIPKIILFFLTRVQKAIIKVNLR